MRNKVLSAVVLCALLTGCGQTAGGVTTDSNDSSTPSSTPTATETSSDGSATITSEQAESALLSVTDLPTGAGWMLKPPGDGSSTGPQEYDAVDPPDCDPGDIDPAFADPTGAVEASAAFQDGGENTFTMTVQSGLTAKPDEILDFMTERLDDCPVVSTLSGDQAIRADYEPNKDFPSLGDRTLAYKSTIEASTSSWPVWVYAVYVVVDGNLLTFTARGRSAAGDGTLRELVPTAVDRFATVTR